MKKILLFLLFVVLLLNGCQSHCLQEGQVCTARTNACCENLECVTPCITDEQGGLCAITLTCQKADTNKTN
ncbi:MAG: hypothetical protein A3K77_04170 [Euryarchaeota archaeon RBG_13_31_8]|nr:MAG: hypothetical protein A3K77_04170 [Euryarchaeota archaeon RBG_13_31_8]